MKLKKQKCPECNRQVGVTKDGIFAKHRIGRSKPNNVKPYCSASGQPV